MLNQLHKLLESLNLNFEDLTSDEKKVYGEWAKVLNTPEVTIDDLRKFLGAQIEVMEAQQNDYSNSHDKDLFLKALIRNAKMIQAFITGAEKRREWLDKHISQKINK